MKTVDKLKKYVSDHNIYETMTSLAKKESSTVFTFVESMIPFLDTYRVLDSSEWIRTLFDYACFKSFPHKKTALIDDSLIDLYEATLNVLQEINGAEYLEYDFVNSLDEFDVFVDAYKNRYVYELMQLDLAATGHNTIEHVIGVKDVAMHISLQLQQLGLPLDLGIILGSSLGHDVGKYGVTDNEQSRVPYLHYYYTEQWFKELGLEKIGHIATNHSTWDLELETLPLESLVLIYSDFRVKNRLVAGEYKMHIFTLAESFQVILDKLDNVDEAKEKRYIRVYNKLRDFEDYIVSLGVDTTLMGSLTPSEKIYWSLLRGEEIVSSFKHKSIENNLFLMANLVNHDKFLTILEDARSQANWRRLRLYLEILKEYSTYLTQRQKVIVLHFLIDLMLHKEEDVRKEASELIGGILSNYDEEYRKELPAMISRKDSVESSEDVFHRILNDLLYPSYKLAESQNEWLYNLKIIVKSLFETCQISKIPIYFDKLNEFYRNSESLTPVAQFYLVQTINYIPYSELNSNRKDQLNEYILKRISSENVNIRLSALDRTFEIISKYDDEKLNSPLKKYLSQRTEKSDIPAENYSKYIMATKLKVDEEICAVLRTNYYSDQSNVSELFLENLKTATSWTNKKINIDILYDQVRKNPQSTGIHTAIHLCNLLKVSAVERVRNYSGYTLLNIIPLLTLEQRNDVAIELLRALEMDSYQFTKFIPEYLGHLILHLPPKELDELIDDLEEKIQISRPQTVILLLNTIGTAILGYPVYKTLFSENYSKNIKRLYRLLGLLLVPLSSYKLEIKTEALRVIATTVFNSEQLSLEDKYTIFKRVGKKLLTLMDDARENAFIFYNTAASLNHIYRFISEFEFQLGKMDIETEEDVVFFPGSFDPFSLSHREIAKEMTKHGFEVYLAVDEFSWSKRTEAHQFRRDIINMSIAKEDKIFLFPKEIPINISNNSDMRNLKTLFGKRQVYLAVGSDVLNNASAYRGDNEILNFSHVIFDRKSETANYRDESRLESTIARIKGNVVKLTLPTQYEDISSTKIRENIDKNRDISKLIDPMAADYIFNYGLYLREPLYKTLLETKTIDIDVHRNLSHELFEYLMKHFGESVNAEGLLDIKEKLSYRIILLMDTETNSPLGFSAFYWVRHSMLYEEFKDQEITEYIRNNAKGRTAFITGMYAKDDDDNLMDMILNETLSIALNRDYNYALYCNTMVSGDNKKAEDYMDIQGFVKTPYVHKDAPLFMVDMNNPITLNLDLENTLKSPYDRDPRIQKVILNSRKELKKSLANLFPGELLISFNRDMVYSKLIQKICDENNVPVNDSSKRRLGNKMCVPFGIILNNSIIPNTVTKTLHTERIFAPDIQSFTVGNFPNYLTLEQQAKTIKSFNRPVILLDDLLHKGYRLKIVEPLLRKENIEISKLFVGILSGKGREIAEIRKLNVDSAYFVPNLKLWFNESGQYPFLGGDMVESSNLDNNLIPSVNFILPYVSPRFIKAEDVVSIYNMSETSLNNTVAIFKEIERLYQEINERNLTISSLSEVIHIPRYPDLERGISEKRFMKPSSFIEMDLDYLKRLEHTLKGYKR
ncbi:MAG: cytidyltransferase [Gudongella sp.]|nr:cytidyltransferase [Gudongella sp.]